MPDHYLSSSLAAYGRVVSVKNLTVRGRAHIRKGTHMVRMWVSTPIPPEITIATFRCAVRYRSQPKYCFGCRQVGELQHLCPTSGRQRKPLPDRLLWSNLHMRLLFTLHLRWTWRKLLSSSLSPRLLSPTVVVEISEFSELCAADDKFPCQRRVTIVQNRTSSKGMDKRFQGARSVKESRATSSPLPAAPLAPPEATPSPQSTS